VDSPRPHFLPSATPPMRLENETAISGLSAEPAQQGSSIARTCIFYLIAFTGFSAAPLRLDTGFPVESSRRRKILHGSFPSISKCRLQLQR
jgi:hypothetical protein